MGWDGKRGEGLDGGCWAVREGESSLVWRSAWQEKQAVLDAELQVLRD